RSAHPLDHVRMWALVAAPLFALGPGAREHAPSRERARALRVRREDGHVAQAKRKLFEPAKAPAHLVAELETSRASAGVDRAASFPVDRSGQRVVDRASVAGPARESATPAERAAGAPAHHELERVVDSRDPPRARAVGATPTLHVPFPHSTEGR